MKCQNARMAGATHRQEIGTTIKAYLPILTKQGWLEPVRARVSEPVRAMLDAPTRVKAWIDSSQVDEIYVAVEQVAGEDGVRLLTSESTRASFAPIVRRLAGTLLGLFGATPATLLSRGDALTSSFVRGASFTWTEDGPHAGTLIVRQVEPAPRLAYVAWAGVLENVFELTSHAGTLTLVAVEDGGRAGRFVARWEP